MSAAHHNGPKIVIVTGASSGIGRATALAFGRRGDAVVLAARRADRLQEVALRIEQLAAQALVVPTDVRDAAALRHLVDATVERFGRVDVLVNNAGAGYSGAVEETPEAVMRDLFELNYMSAFQLTRLVLPIMRRQNSGHVVNVSSVVGKMSFPLHGAYAATKSALVAMTEALRGELAGTGITASVVLPVTTRTDFFDAQAAASPRRVPSPGPMQSAERVAGAIVASVARPTPEVNPLPPLRVAYALNALFPRLRDIAGRQYMRRAP